MESRKTIAPFGLWPSPITAETMAASNVSLHEVRVNINHSIYWIESGPQEQGRYAIMEHGSNGSHEVLPKSHSAHAMMQELGGGSFEIDAEQRIIFSEKHDKNVYTLVPKSNKTSLILQASPSTCYTDFAVHPSKGHWIIAIKEDSSEATPETQAYGVHNTLVAIDRRSGKEYQLTGGDDFYAYPRFSPGGSEICWVQWSHPDMPWTGTRLFIAMWHDGHISNVREIAGQKLHESISQPRWSPDGNLYFASDRTGYWQLYVASEDRGSVKQVPARGLEKYEFARADWLLASSTYIFLDAQTIVASCARNGTSNIFLLDIVTGSQQDLGLSYVDLAMPATGIFRVSTDSFAILGSTQSQSKHLALVSNVRGSASEVTVLRSTTSTPLPVDSISTAKHLEVPRSSRNGKVHAFYFAPQHHEVEGPPGVAPPGLIHVHGGPNGITSPALDFAFQYWTSRGFAVCSVNYIGSVGHGRQYREDLTGHWGLCDIEDTHDVVQYLKQQGLVDPGKVGIYGGSAGGYCTLSAIHMFPDSFAAAISSYGISDLKALQGDAYKFESHDVERLALSSISPEDTAAREDLLRFRSPRYHADKIKAPLLILQGSIDKAVPPEQAQIMAAEMSKNGRECKVVEFEGEAYGWLRGNTILRAYREQRGLVEETSLRTFMRREAITMGPTCM